MKVKTSELIDADLDWAVAKCIGVELFPWPNGTLNIYRAVTDDYAVWEPHCRWEQGGPIIEREKISPAYEPSFVYDDSCRWKAQGAMSDGVHYGPTPLIAAMRCYVASVLGDEVEIPEELT